MSNEKEIISICKGFSCTLMKAEEIVDEFENQILESKLEDRVIIERSRCKGICHHSPNLSLLNKKEIISKVNIKDVKDILSSIDEGELS